MTHCFKTSSFLSSPPVASHRDETPSLVVVQQRVSRCMVWPLPSLCIIIIIVVMNQQTHPMDIVVVVQKGMKERQRDTTPKTVFERQVDGRKVLEEEGSGLATGRVRNKETLWRDLKKNNIIHNSQVFLQI